MKKITYTILILVLFGLSLNSQVATNPLQKRTSVPINIIGVGNVSQKTLQNAKLIVWNFFGIIPEVKNNITISINYFTDGQTIDGNKFINNFLSETKTIYITNSIITGDNTLVRGITQINGKTILVQNGDFLRETIIHEIGHTIGLYHCDNLSCIMAIHNDDYDSGDFCSKCKNSLIK